MEARTLKNKKVGLKGKLKNIISRPDPPFWPSVSESDGKIIISALHKHKIDIPIFNKPHWQQLKLMHKNERPKPPKLKKINGLLFGIKQCTSSIQCDQCSAVILEGSINPRMILQPIIDTCIDHRVPVVCLNGLKEITSSNFGICTSCLGIKQDVLPELSESICEIAKLYKPPEDSIEIKEIFSENFQNKLDEELNISGNSVNGTSFYLFRTDKKSRVFTPLRENMKIDIPPQKILKLSVDEKRKHNKGTKGAKKLHKKMIIKSIKNNKNRNEKIKR